MRRFIIFRRDSLRRLNPVYANNLILNYSLNDAFDAIGIGRVKGYELINSGALKTLKIGRRRVVSKKHLLEFQKNLEKAGFVE